MITQWMTRMVRSRTWYNVWLSFNWLYTIPLRSDSTRREFLIRSSLLCSVVPRTVSKKGDPMGTHRDRTSYGRLPRRIVMWHSWPNRKSISSVLTEETNSPRLKETFGSPFLSSDSCHTPRVDWTQVGVPEWTVSVHKLGMRSWRTPRETYPSLPATLDDLEGINFRGD